MKKTKKFIKNYLLGIILGVLFLSTVTVFASTTLHAKNFIFSSANVSSLSSDITVQVAIEDLYKKDFCPSGYKCYKPKRTPEVGDYVKMTPTLTSFTTDTTKTGYTETQTINPSELNLWRVIRVNSDGTIEIVSENVSSVKIGFRGKTGYKNSIGYLNLLASKYENSKYTIGSRHIGYNGQTQYLTNTINTVDSTTPPWTNTTLDNTNEIYGGGDMLYQTDLNLLKSIYGRIFNYSEDGTEILSYWLASRIYKYYDSSQYYSLRQVCFRGNIEIQYLYKTDGTEYSVSDHLRPILILKQGINYKQAVGTKDDPFILE